MSATVRKPIIAANWKMHHDHLVAIQVVQKLSYRLDADDYEACDVVIAPPFTDLRTLQTIIESDKLGLILGAQNCYFEDKGAFTGEVSAADAREAQRGVRHRRPLRAAAALRRDRRVGQPEGQGGPEARDDADRVRRGDARGARGGPHRHTASSRRPVLRSPGSRQPPPRGA